MNVGILRRELRETQDGGLRVVECELGKVADGIRRGEQRDDEEQNKCECCGNAMLPLETPGR